MGERAPLRVGDFRYFLIRDVAARLGKSESWLKRYLKKHPVGRRAGRTLLLTEADFQAIVNSMAGRELKPDVVYVERGWRNNQPKQNLFAGSAVYFIVSSEYVSGEYVKIGWAANVRRRFAQLQIAHPEPLEIVFQVKGGGVEEAALHAKFASHRVRGEWFRFVDEIKAWIADPERVV